MNSPYLIRPATLNDAPVLARQNVAMALETEGLALDYAVTLRAVKRILTHPALGQYWVMADGPTVCCRLFITYEYSDWRDLPYWWIQSVYTEPAYRGQGCYKGLYAHVLAAAQAAGAGSVRLYVAQDNAAALRIYTQLGMAVGHYVVAQQDF
jgi:GNAT superfamily N-acetyltransferase